MKKFLIFGIYMVFLLCMLASCGGGTEGGSVENGEEAEPPQEEAEAPKLLSQAELETLFQKVFDSEGDIQSQEDTQITAELSAVKGAADADTLPEDYETLYRSWREGQVTAWETEVEQLKEDYKKMLLADTDLTAAWDAGRDCYANYVDFDGDGMPELLRMSASLDGGYVLTTNIKVYGKTQDGISELCNDDFEIYTDGALESNWIRLCKNKENHQTYLAVGFRNMGSASPTCQRYYSLISGEWVHAEGFGLGRHDVVDENGTWLEYRSSWHVLSETEYVEYGEGEFGKPITDDEYEAAVGKYVDYQDILSSGTKFRFIEGGGFLSELFTIKLTVNGEPVELGTQPFAEKGVFMAPVRPVLEAMGVAVYAMSKEAYADWRADDNFTRSIITGDPRPGPHQVVAATKKNMLVISRTWDDNAIANYGDYYLYCNDQMIEGYPPHMAGTQMVAPLTKMVECFGGSVVWSPDIRTLAVTCSIPETDRMSEAEIKSMVGFSLNDAAKVIEKQGYYKLEGFESYDDFGRSGSCWTFPVCPKGSEYQSEWLWDEIEGEKIVTNATWVTVYSDGTIVWGEAYEESLV